MDNSSKVSDDMTFFFASCCLEVFDAHMNVLLGSICDTTEKSLLVTRWYGI